ncbi:mRNA (N6-adenosine)-methyltransferase [Saccharomycopsis crataegensis]|uniref:mRNA m(6)A methyltransferase n=1 Tax=Saccharomycopsis crataegensis TaxID=43959 RepID=A0AAV5QSY1_9ASCO|nr:mRNA (N6-adenosine)-methyltransferase [Saccharomycopsis crataegensis]
MLSSLVSFLLHSHHIITSNEKSVFETYYMFQDYNKVNDKVPPKDLENYLELLFQIKQISQTVIWFKPNSLNELYDELSVTNTDIQEDKTRLVRMKLDNYKFDIINVLELNILDQILHPSSNINKIDMSLNDCPTTKTSLNDFDSIMEFLEKPVSKKFRILNSTPSPAPATMNEILSLDYEIITTNLLEFETAGNQLNKEIIPKITPKRPFLETCTDESHAVQMARISKFECERDSYNKMKTVNKSYNRKDKHFQNDYLNITHNIDQKMYNKFPHDMRSCFEKKIHFIPYYKTSRKTANNNNNKAPFTNAYAGVNTDMSIGDCSYLDTCFKWDDCKYVHYYTCYPTSELDKQLVECQEFNKGIMKNNKIRTFYWHEPSGYNIRNELPAQWVKCDIYNINMSIFGKFGAIIVDPAWSIHMELQFQQIEDHKIISTPVQPLQDEGIIILWVTGRSYEVGKKCLETWGYEYVQELVWTKTNQLNRTICTGRTGHWLNHSKEHAIIGMKGRPQWLNRKIDVDLIVASAREASRKPDELYGIVERVVGPHCRKMELFGRQHNTRSGWFTIGDQIQDVNIYEEEVKRKYQKWLGRR